MSLKVLSISFVDGTNIGSIVLNGLSGTKLQKFKINKERGYEEKIRRKNLLCEGHDYDAFTFEEYITRIQKGLRKDLGRKVLIKEKRLNYQRKKLLLKKYSL